MRVTKVYDEGQTTRVIGQHLNDKMELTGGALMAFNVVRDGDKWQEVNKLGRLNSYLYSTFIILSQPIQMELPLLINN